MSRRRATSRERMEEEEVELNIEDKEATTVGEVEVMVRETPITAVSYTHLDVYKRQILYNTKFYTKLLATNTVWGCFITAVASRRVGIRKWQSRYT